MPKLISISKLTLLSIAFALLIVGIGGVTMFQFRKISSEDGLVAFANIEMIWALLVFVSYRFVFGHLAPSDVPNMQLDRLGVASLFGALVIGFMSEIGGFLFLLLSKPTFTFLISPKAIIYSFGAAFGISVLEEVIFRGLLFSLLVRFLPSYAAVLVVALVFTIAHIDGRSNLALASLFLGGGLAFTVALMAFKSLWVPIGLHAGSNFVGMIVSGVPGMGGGFVRITTSQYAIDLAQLVGHAILLICVLAGYLYALLSKVNYADPD